jgi:hypothetical protein
MSPTIPFDRPVSLSVWKNARPLAPSGIWAGKNSPKYLRFCAVLPFEKSRKTESKASTFTPSMSQQAS